MSVLRLRVRVFWCGRQARGLYLSLITRTCARFPIAEIWDLRMNLGGCIW